MNVTNPRQDIPWKLLALVAAAIMLPLYFIGYAVIYTEGEVAQGLFVGLIWILVVIAVVVSVFTRRGAAYLISGAGGLLLVWQSYQIRKWTMVQEELFRVIRELENVKGATGEYPATLDAGIFRYSAMQDHIANYTTENQKFRITYFISDPGVAYWYDSKTGFNYYPD